MRHEQNKYIHSRDIVDFLNCVPVLHCAGLHVNRATFDLSTKLQQVHACSSSVHKQLTANASRLSVLSSIADGGDEDVDGASKQRNEKNSFEIWENTGRLHLRGRHLPISNSAHRTSSILTAIINNRTVFVCHRTKLSCASL